jgi:hypothetical protein
MYYQERTFHMLPTRGAILDRAFRKLLIPGPTVKDSLSTDLPLGLIISRAAQD